MFSKELKLLVLNIVYILNVSLFNNSFTIFIIFFGGLLIAANPEPMARLRLLFYRLNISKNIKNVSFEGLKTNS